MEKEQRVYETVEWAPLAVLFHEADLEVMPEDPVPRKLVKMWRSDDPETGALLGAITLQHRGGAYALGHMAVDPSARDSGLGKALQEAVFAEVRALGGRELWTCARIPQYYIDCGWQVRDPEEAPKISDCQYCDRFRKECFPEILSMTLE